MLLSVYAEKQQLLAFYALKLKSWIQSPMKAEKEAHDKLAANYLFSITEECSQPKERNSDFLFMSVNWKITLHR